MKRKIVRERGKVRLDLVPGPALDEEARALDHGNRKPGRGEYNWRQNRVSSADQISAALRHIKRWQDGQERDPGSGAHELGHARARLGIIIDAIAAGTLVDDRVVAKKRRGK
jgi:hypothetical protein